MNWLTQLFTFSFKKNTPSDKAEVDSVVLPTEQSKDDIAPDKLEPSLPLSEIVDSPLSTSTQAFVNPDWIDEEAIRDEGVIYGLTQTPPDTKREAIKAHFARLSAPHQSKFTDLAQEIHVINKQISEIEKRVSLFINEKNELQETPHLEHNFLRVFVGLVFSVAMSIGNFFLIDECIRYTYPDNHFLITTGVFLAGMFNLFQAKSVLHDTKTPVSFRNLLEEIGLPFAASFFVFVQIFSAMNLLESIALFVLTFFLFLFTGKLVLGNLSIIRKEWESWQQNTSIEKKLKQINLKEKEFIQENREEIILLQEKHKELSDKQSEEQQKLEAMNQQMESLLHLFQSEYDLATTYLRQKNGTNNSSITRY